MTYFHIHFSKSKLVFPCSLTGRYQCFFFTAIQILCQNRLLIFLHFRDFTCFNSIYKKWVNWHELVTFFSCFTYTFNLNFSSWLFHAKFNWISHTAKFVLQIESMQKLLNWWVCFIKYVDFIQFPKRTLKTVQKDAGKIGKTYFILERYGCYTLEIWGMGVIPKVWMLYPTYRSYTQGMDVILWTKTAKSIIDEKLVTLC